MLTEVLHASGPAAGLEERLSTFGRFVGAWTIRWVDAGSGDEETGELHFGWVLAGRAVQDVWAVPSERLAPTSRMRAFHGSTIRFFDPAIDAWRSTWVEPVNGRVRTFIGHEVDGDIVLISCDERPQLRWRFTEITDQSFVWLGEYSIDDGDSWQLEETMYAGRMR